MSGKDMMWALLAMVALAGMWFGSIWLGGDFFAAVKGIEDPAGPGPVGRSASPSEFGANEALMLVAFVSTVVVGAGVYIGRRVLRNSPGE